MKILALPFAALLPVLLAAGCDNGEASSSSDDDPTQEPEDTATLAACDEADFGSAPFQGPYFDEAGQLTMALPETYVVATTAGWPIPTEEHTGKFDEHMGPIVEELPTHEGLLGVTMGGSDVCGSARTLSLWRDEAALMGFVFGDAHTAAMGITYTSMRGWETTHWNETSAEAPSWMDAKAKLDQVRE